MWPARLPSDGRAGMGWMTMDAARSIIHADLDAFYASVEVLDDPSLRGKPVIVGGGPDQRGVVSAASYEARAFGVHSAMPLRTAGRRCPQGVFLPGRPDRYRDVSRQVMAVFASYTPLVEPISLDEAFLDVTASRAAFGDGPTIGRHIKERVRDEIGLVVSVGVASTKLCAKVASDLRKPDALVIVPPGEEAAFLAPLPIRRLWGVGPQLQAALREYGVTTIGQLAALDPQRCSDASAASASTSPTGRWAGMPRRWRRCRRRRASDTSTPSTTTSPIVRRLEATLLDLADSVAGRLRHHDLAAGAVQLKLRYEGFETLTRQAPLPHQTRETDPIYQAGVALLRRTLVAGRAVRLVGITAISPQSGSAADAVRRSRTVRPPDPIDRCRARALRRRCDHARPAAQRAAAPALRLR